MAERHFTPEEAALALVEVRPLAERMVAAAQRVRAHAGNGNGAGDAAAREVAACAARIEERGVLVKDTQSGLLDFPALRDGETVLLCWRVGEPELAWWHRVEDGFAGRRPLPL